MIIENEIDYGHPKIMRDSIAYQCLTMILDEDDFQQLNFVNWHLATTEIPEKQNAFLSVSEHLHGRITLLDELNVFMKNAARYPSNKWHNGTIDMVNAEYPFGYFTIKNDDTDKEEIHPVRSKPEWNELVEYNGVNGLAILQSLFELSQTHLKSVSSLLINEGTPEQYGFADYINDAIQDDINDQYRTFHAAILQDKQALFWKGINQIEPHLLTMQSVKDVSEELATIHINDLSEMGGDSFMDQWKNIKQSYNNINRLIVDVDHQLFEITINPLLQQVDGSTIKFSIEDAENHYDNFITQSRLFFCKNIKTMVLEERNNHQLQPITAYKP